MPEIQSGRGEPRLLLVYCGGTFGMRSSDAGLVVGEDLESELTALMRAASLRRGAPFAWALAMPDRIIDSAAADHGTALEIADLIRDRCREAEQQERPFDGAVVVHGTDTLAHSAAQTAFALADLTISIVFTGAQRPLGVDGTDAERNFMDACDAALDRVGSGVSIAFGGRVLPAVRAVKRSSERDDAFAARRPLESASAALPAETRAAIAGAAGAPGPQVGMLTAVPGLPSTLMRAALEAFPDGLVLECYGAGTAPFATSETLAVLRDAAERGTPILAVTRCEDGAVDLPRYAVGAALHEIGVIGGADLTAEAAIAKLRALRRAGYSGERLRALLQRNLIGEQRALDAS
ncbi:asparaginase [Leucobacter tardus]|uniref:Asparaginase n=1 Tax=Leucobacter tardus TaxID=501483 RepID=A0A939QEA8_9MICO|nr:asparaginase domain-containing protein [Leucobacter tardus]MBO2990560.1 asparaginase [Leucobacter tardus]